MPVLSLDSDGTRTGGGDGRTVAIGAAAGIVHAVVDMPFGAQIVRGRRKSARPVLLWKTCG